MATTLASGVQGLNPARLSPGLGVLFPPGVVGAELTEPAPAGLLTEPEYGVISHCAEKRIRDFSAGRLCARRALQEFGVVDFSLLPAPDRQPIWPHFLTGSITHTDGYSAAVVGRRREFLGLGVDTEAVASVHEELWERVCTDTELARLGKLPPEARAPAAALLFTAKEAFYKCQYPLSTEWLEFHDIEIESADFGCAAGQFAVRPRRALRITDMSRRPFGGHFRSHGSLLTSAVALSA